MEGRCVWISDPNGHGLRHSEVHQTLNEEQAATPKTCANLYIKRIKTDFELGSIGCGDVKNVCLEFAKGDTPDPPFAMRFDNGDDWAFSNSLITCKKQECSKRK